MKPHKEVQQNENGNIYFLGDIHGDLDLVQRSLESVNFNYSQDLLISVGDLIDRGPDSLECLRLLDEPWFYAIQGNHESLLIKNYETINDASLRHWCQRNGGYWWLDLTNQERNEAYKLAKNMPLAITVNLMSGNSIGVTHAEPQGGDWKSFVKLLERGDKTAVWLSQWSRVNIKENLKINCTGVECVIVGHVPVPTPTALGNVIYLDTGLHNKKINNAPFPIIGAGDALTLTREHREAVNLTNLEINNFDVEVFEIVESGINFEANDTLIR